MLKKLNNYLLNVDEGLTKDSHLVEVIKLNSDNTYSQKIVCYQGSISTFKNMNDELLISTMEKLLQKEDYSKFHLSFNISVDIE